MSMTLQFDEYKMRLLNKEDTENYYKCAIVELDEEVKYFTGTNATFKKQQIIDYIMKIINDKTRLDFIIEKDGKFIGEVVLSDITKTSCHYRIALFNKNNFSKGIGKKASKEVFQYAFDHLGINEIELEVYPFNERGINAYKKMGFEEIETIFESEEDVPYQEIIIMKLDKESFKNINK